MKKIISLILTLLLLLSMTACGGAGNASEDVSGTANSNSGSTGSSGAGEISLEAPDYVKSAMELSFRLTSGNYFLLEDGSIVTIGKSYDNFAGEYAALPNLKTIADSCSEMELFALTQDGEVYYHDTKILEGVEDLIYSTTNVNQQAMAIAGDKIYCITVRPPEMVVDALRQANPDSYFDVGTQVVSYSEATWMFSKLEPENATKASGTLVYVNSEKSDFMVLNAAGSAFMDNNFGSSEEYIGMECFDWENLVIIDAAKRMLSDVTDSEQSAEATVAGIQADGTVVACGLYADEIKSWGPLAYISMEPGLIVGLTPEGTLKLTGPCAEYVAADVADWKNIVAVETGTTSKTQLLINAMDSDGLCYQLAYDSRWGENSLDILSPTAGCLEGDTDWWYKYCPDGTVYRTSGENGAWETYTEN